jgi:hypothetical protein
MAMYIALLAFGFATARAQVVRLSRQNAARPRLGGLGSLFISATPPVVTFNLSAGSTAFGSAGITISSLGQSLSVGTVSLYAYFSSNAALSDGVGDAIPSSAVFGLCATGTPTSYTAMTQAGPFSTNSSLLVWRSTDLLQLQAGRTDVLQLQINLTQLPQLPAGNYSGTLLLQAQAL